MLKKCNPVRFSTEEILFENDEYVIFKKATDIYCFHKGTEETWWFPAWMTFQPE